MTKICKRGHPQTPENNKGHCCLLCQKQWVLDNSEHLKESRKKYYQEHKEKIKKYISIWAKTHRDAVSTAKRKSFAKYKDRDRDKLNQKSREWQALNRPDKQQRQILADCYVAKTLKSTVAECHPELLELKRQQLIMRRTLKEVRKYESDHTNVNGQQHEDAAVDESNRRCQQA
jgi:hypothetical protein